MQTDSKISSFLKLASEGNKNAIIKRRIIRQYLTGGDCSLTDLSREMGLSVPTVTKLVGELIDEGFVHDFGKQSTSGGRRPNLYGLNPDAGYFLGVDVCNNHVSFGLINFKGRLIKYKKEVPFSLAKTKPSLDELCDLIDATIAGFGIARKKILSIGINLSGRVDSASGYSFSYFYTEDKPLTRLLEERLGCNVNIENDSRAMAYGEYMCGGCNNEKNVICINVSWGLGIGIILNGQLFYGHSGFSGEFGHFPFFDNEIICRCGKRGCLETGASGLAVHRIICEMLAQGRASMLSEKYDATGDVSLNDILDAVHKEDVLAIEVVEQVSHQLGKAIAGLINIFNPELIIIGGTLSTAGQCLMLAVQSAIYKYSLQLVSKDTTVRLSTLAGEAGVLGACMLARSKTLCLV